MKTEIINALDKFERKYIKWDFLYMVIAIFAVVWIFHTVTREVEVIDRSWSNWYSTSKRS